MKTSLKIILNNWPNKLDFGLLLTFCFVVQIEIILKFNVYHETLKIRGKYYGT
jgi:hypothetical protein